MSACSRSTHAAQVAHVGDVGVPGLDGEDDLLGLVAAGRRGSRGGRRCPGRCLSSARPAARPPAPAPTTGTGRGLALPVSSASGTETGSPMTWYLAASPKASCRRCLIRVMARCVMSMPIQRRLQRLRDDDGRAAAAEGVEHHVAFVAAGLDDALQQCFGLLGGVAEALGACALMGRDVVPYIAERLALASRPGSACSAASRRLA